MKRAIILVICCMGVFLLCSCGNDQADITEAVAEDTASETISTDEAEALLISSLGTEDPETGNTYSFGYMDTITVDGVEYFAFNWSWYVNSEHLSRLGDIFVATDGSGIYDGVYNALGDSEVYTEYNYK